MLPELHALGHDCVPAGLPTAPYGLHHNLGEPEGDIWDLVYVVVAVREVFLGDIEEIVVDRCPSQLVIREMDRCQKTVTELVEALDAPERVNENETGRLRIY
jgi:hypothetical protein